MKNALNKGFFKYKFLAYENLGGMRLGFDESGNPGYYDPDGNFKAFISTSVSPVDIFTIPPSTTRTLVVEEDSINYTIVAEFRSLICTLNGESIDHSTYGLIDGDWALVVFNSVVCKKGDVVTITNRAPAYHAGVAISKTNPTVDVFTLTNKTSREIVLDHDSNCLFVATSWIGTSEVKLNSEILPMSLYGSNYDEWGLVAIKGVACKKGDVLKITSTYGGSMGFIITY